MTYQERWLFAVAMRQSYPRLETGAEEPPPNPVPPPEFSAAELAPAAKEYQRKLFWGGIALGAVGAVLIDRLFVHRMLRA